MRERRSKRNDLAIDLTSLLDVIFIILLVVLCSQQITKLQYEKREQTVAEKVQETEAEYELYKDQLDTGDNLNQYVFAVSVYSNYNPDLITVRTIYILKEGQEIEHYDLNGNDTVGALDKFKNDLSKYIQDNSNNQPVILSLNEKDEKILYRDEKAILEIFDELKKEYSNIYIK